MTFRVVLSAAAEADLGRAVTWYVHRAPAHASRLIDEYEATTARISAFPHAAPVLRQEARRAILRVYPYQLWYYCDDER